MSAPGYLSALPGMLWPALPASPGSQVLALLFQLEQTQWLSPARLAQMQSAQLARLLAHAWRTVPFYRRHWGGEPAAGDLPGLMPLERRDLQQGFDALRSGALPADHGGAGESRTSGATGTPVRVLRTGLNALMGRALTLRDHRWHARDLGAKVAGIRQGFDAGEDRSWGEATDGVLRTGPAVRLPIAADVASQLDWLARERPAYLFTYPSNVTQLIRLSLERGERLPGLREVRTLGEQLDPELRPLVREAWGARVTDVYSAQEVGHIALQCPEREHYHVQGESLIVEVLDDAGRPCAPGQVGRIAVTDLHNFATPLVRYVIGDYAEAGEPCACGRGLPVLARVVGRVRNTLIAPDGRKYWPNFGARGFADIAPVLQHQFVQKARDLVEARLVTARPLSAAEEESLRSRIASRLPAGLRIEFAYPGAIPRSAGGKYEDFISEVS